MKWFKHEADAHTNMKLQALIDQLGIAGYGYYWACVELVASQGGDEFKIVKEKHWEDHLKKMLNIEPKDQKKYLIVLARHNLIDLKSLKLGNLYIPKLEERCDEYTEKKKRNDKIGRVSRHNRDNVGVEQNRTEQNRKEYNSSSYLKKIPEIDLEVLYQRFDASKKAIQSKAEDLLAWCETNGRVKKNYKTFLLVALKKDFPERKEPLKIIRPQFPKFKATVDNEVDNQRTGKPIPKDIKASIEKLLGKTKIND